jgi:NADP-dependent 3-hydroxy acid dehydrogenase YdfG
MVTRIGRIRLNEERRMSTLEGKVTIVTGASSGIGEATALALARRGCRLVLAARRRDRIEALARRIVENGGHAVAVECDVAKREEVAAVVETARRDFGGVDILINNAGVMPLSMMARGRIDDWEETIDVNVKGVLFGIGHALPIMIEQKAGHIVNVSSVAGRRAFPGAAVYCASKHAVHALSECLRGELSERAARDGSTIRVTIVAPGVVTTELPDSIRDERSREANTAYYDSIRGPLTSDDVAAAIVYALEAPPHVNVNEILVRPTGQAM